MPLVSVIVPVYNVEKYILRCISSIQQQSLTDIEIIVVNDCTPDNSMTIVSRLAENDKRIRILNNERNRGPMIARERGYMAATGEYITFCDSDDFLSQNAIERLYDTAKESDADIVSGNAVYCDVSGKEKLWTSELKYGNTKSGILKSLLHHELGHNLWGKLFRAFLLQGFNYKTYENMTNGEDACLFYQIIRNINGMVLIPDIVYKYVQNPESSSQRRRSTHVLENLCLASSEIIKVVCEYDELKDELDAFVSETMVSLIYRGYNKDGTLTKLFSKYGLDNFCSNKTIIKSHSTQNAIKLLLKKYVFRKQVG